MISKTIWTVAKQNGLFIEAEALNHGYLTPLAGNFG